MNQAALSRVLEFLNQLVGTIVSGTSGIGLWLFITGLALLAILVLAIVIKLLVNLVKILPNLTIGQFVKFVLVFGIILVVLGLIVP